MREGYVNGIDVSHHNDLLDEDNWKRFRSMGYKFAFVKLSEGTTFIDRQGRANMERAWAAKIHVAGYHFFRPLLNAELQMKNFMAQYPRPDKDYLLPPVIDIEWAISGKSDQWKMMPLSDRILRMTRAIMSLELHIERKPIIYTAASFFNDTFAGSNTRLSWLNDYPLWIADYGNNRARPRLPFVWKEWSIWQYTDNNGKLDENIWNPQSRHFKELAK
jgi:lysozyme